MPRPRSINPTYIRLRLTPQDYLRLQRQAAAQRVPLTVVARTAVSEWLDSEEEDLFAQKIARDRQRQEASHNRLCALFAKVAIDVRTSLNYFLEKHGSSELMQSCRLEALRQIKNTLSPEEREIFDGLSQVIKGQNS